MKNSFQKVTMAWKQAAVWLRMAALAAGIAVLAAGIMLYAPPSTAQAADVTCKELCQAVLGATGNGDKLEYQSSNAQDFGGFSISDREKVSSIMYVYDAKEIYSICVIKTSKKSESKQLLKSLKAYKANNSGSDYLSDYTPDEQKVFQNAICGKKGKFVWYIAMSPTKSVNKKGQAAIKKSI